jgi:hypothetical protein
MSIVLFSILALFFVLLGTYVLYHSFIYGKWEYFIYFLLLFLPVYISFLSITYLSTENLFLIKVFQALKELIVLSAVFSFALFHKDLWAKPWRLHWVDLLFSGFILLAAAFLLLPIGAPLMSKLLYFKSMIIPALVYFLGRNTQFKENELNRVFQFILIVAVAAFFVNLVENALNIHLQSLIGYANYNLAINDIESSGNFGLTWTFETQAVTKRLASFYADPLELASSVLLGFSVALILFLTSKREQGYLYVIVLLMCMLSLFFSASRAAFGAFFVMLIFIAIVLKMYKLIFSALMLLLVFVIYVVFFASDDFYYFVLDTVTFENSSSLGHVIEWLIALDSMYDNPFGIGLGMSGNFGAVTDELRVGGENQFLIFGVQMGWLGMLLYVFLLILSIYYCIKTYYLSPNLSDARMAFVAGTVKFGLILPLFTANVEIYTYVSWVTWWMVGYSIKNYQELRFSPMVSAS